MMLINHYIHIDTITSPNDWCHVTMGHKGNLSYIKNQVDHKFETTGIKLKSVITDSKCSVLLWCLIQTWVNVNKDKVWKLSSWFDWWRFEWTWVAVVVVVVVVVYLCLQPWISPSVSRSGIINTTGRIFLRTTNRRSDVWFFCWGQVPETTK